MSKLKVLLGLVCLVSLMGCGGSGASSGGSEPGVSSAREFKKINSLDAKRATANSEMGWFSLNDQNIFFGNDDSVYLSSYRGIYRSKDHGRTFSKVLSSNGFMQLKFWSVDRKGNIYGVPGFNDGRTVLLKSTDQGRTFEKMFEISNSSPIAFLVDENGILYLQVSSSDPEMNKYEIFVSRDEGKTYERYGKPDLVRKYEYFKVYLDSKNQFYLSIHGNLFKSSDTAKTFNPVTLNEDVSANGLLVTSNGTLVFYRDIASDNGTDLFLSLFRQPFAAVEKIMFHRAPKLDLQRSLQVSRGLKQSDKFVFPVYPSTYEEKSNSIGIIDVAGSSFDIISNGLQDANIAEVAVDNSGRIYVLSLNKDKLADGLYISE